MAPATFLQAPGPPAPLSPGAGASDVGGSEFLVAVVIIALAVLALSCCRRLRLQARAQGKGPGQRSVRTELGSQPDPQALVMIDFDQTLASFHIYASLAGTDLAAKSSTLPIPEPFARTELGQLRRLCECVDQGLMSEEGGLVVASFGGAERLRRLAVFLGEVQGVLGARLVVCSFGYVGPVRKMLSEAGLLHFFSDIYGKIGDFHIKGDAPRDANHQGTRYDETAAQTPPSDDEKRYLGNGESTWDDKTSKVPLLNKLKKDMGLEKHRVIMIDDDDRGLRAAQNICQTVHVVDARGMTDNDCDDVLQRLRAPAPAEPPSEPKARPSGRKDARAKYKAKLAERK